MRLFPFLLAAAVGLAVSGCNATATATKHEAATSVIKEFNAKQDNASVFQEDTTFDGSSASDDFSQLDSEDSEEIEERAISITQQNLGANDEFIVESRAW
ncbi:hypothetical protein DVH05_000240 [Phytophthora capsici]|nr:hypothetical protein DVH05_000240 [Phytophthora capsici]